MFLASQRKRAQQRMATDWSAKAHDGPPAGGHDSDALCGSGRRLRMALHAGDVVEIPKSNMTFCRSGMIMIARHIIHVPYIYIYIYTYINIHYILYMCMWYQYHWYKICIFLPGMINSNVWDVLLSHRLGLFEMCVFPLNHESNMAASENGAYRAATHNMAISMGKMNENEWKWMNMNENEGF